VRRYSRSKGVVRSDLDQRRLDVVGKTGEYYFLDMLALMERLQR
jgi:hypothetical protein